MCAIVASNILFPQKPGSFNGPVPGTGGDIVGPDGASLPPGEIGELVMREACIGTTRGLWRDEQRYLDSYWTSDSEPLGAGRPRLPRRGGLLVPAWPV